MDRFSSTPILRNEFIVAKVELISPANENWINFERNKCVALNKTDESVLISCKCVNKYIVKFPIIKQSGVYTNVCVSNTKGGVLSFCFNNRAALAFKVQSSL